MQEKQIITIGMVGGVAPQFANKVLYEVLDNCTNNHLCIADQQHPEYINVSINTNGDLDKLITFTKILVAANADIIVLPASLSDEEISVLKEKAATANIPVITPNTDVIYANEADAAKALASEIVTKIQELNIADPFKKKLINNGIVDTPEVIKNFQATRKPINLNREHHIDDKFVGVIGGGGVEAGLAFATKLTNKNVPHILYSMSAVPDKNNAVLEVGNSFVPDYKYGVEFFKNLNSPNLKIAIPCNTAHALAGQIFDGEEEKLLLDIRLATQTFISQQCKDVNKFILFATPATIKKGIYDPYFTGKKLIIPNDAQQNNITTAIYDIKKGYHKVLNQKDLNKKAEKSVEFKTTRAYQSPLDRLVRTIEEIKKNPEYKDAKVIFACTELGLPFDSGRQFSCVDTLNALAESCDSYKTENIRNSRSRSSSSDGIELTDFCDSSSEQSGSEKENQPQSFDEICTKFKVKKEDFSYSKSKHGTIRIYAPQILTNDVDCESSIKENVKTNVVQTILLQEGLLQDLKHFLIKEFPNISPSSVKLSGLNSITYLRTDRTKEVIELNKIENFLQEQKIPECEKKKIVKKDDSKENSPQRKSFVYSSGRY
jgi:aspartate/glutamate racemase